MPTLDWVLLGVVGFSVALGIWRGLVYEVLSVASWVAALVVGQWLAPDAGAWLPLAGASEPVRYALGFVLVFVACVFAGGLLAFLVKKLVAAVGLSPVDRALGGLFGALRAGILLLALAVLAGLTPLHTSGTWRDSQGARWADTALHALKPLLPREVGRYLP